MKRKQHALVCEWKFVNAFVSARTSVDCPVPVDTLIRIPSRWEKRYLTVLSLCYFTALESWESSAFVDCGRQDLRWSTSRSLVRHILRDPKWELVSNLEFDPEETS